MDDLRKYILKMGWITLRVHIFRIHGDVSFECHSSLHSDDQDLYIQMLEATLGLKNRYPVVVLNTCIFGIEPIFLICLILHWVAHLTSFYAVKLKLLHPNP